MTSEKRTYWIPLESNPEMMTRILHGMGVDKSWVFGDCFGFDKDLLAMVPQPCQAVLLLYPSLQGDARQKQREEEEERLKAHPVKLHKDVFYMRQLVGNACGTVAIVHSILNGLSDDGLSLDKDSFLLKYLERVKDKSWEERGILLGEDQALEQISSQAARTGQTAAPDAEDKTSFHFICFSSVGGELYELDGVRLQPINHGACPKSELLSKAMSIIKKNWVDKNPNELRFSVITLGPKPQW
eukprot:TRINITY_DN12243_c0_g1_i2.p1 TRINITY_DN12243_c0_g1~~TRINITY_DN12243_c0_g1_i2.p1  ORF type:complete len:242 (-),score=47.02 TRINITY_DN12243_c0_g1_i2:531-1256(-)